MLDDQEHIHQEWIKCRESKQPIAIMLLLVKIGKVQDRFNSSPLKHFIMNSLFDQEMGHILNIDSNQKIL